MKTKQNLRALRVFSPELKKQAVKDIECGKATVLQVSREFGVSEQSVYNWLNKYSRYLHSTVKMVVQMKGESYRSKALEKKIQELEAALGRKQLEIDFLNKMIELGKEELGVDLKKKFSTPPFSGSGSTDRNTDTK